MSGEITVNKSGQSLGRKGRRTRAAIVAGAGQLLREDPRNPPTVAAIAKLAEISAPTFYLYFEDVGEVLIAMLEDLRDEMNAVLALLTEPWPEGQIYPHALRFVRAYFDFWIRHVPILRVRNSLADQGDARFRENRLGAALPIYVALGQKFMDRRRPDGDDFIEGRGAATVVITALERLATVVALELYEGGQRGHEYEWEHNLRALAHIIAESVDKSRCPAS